MIRIVAGSVTALIGVMVWYLKYQTKRQNEREDKREERDAKREEKILNIVDSSLKDLDKTVTKDSENTEKVEKSIDGLKDVISNHLVHSVDQLTTEIQRMNGKK